MTGPRGGTGDHKRYGRPRPTALAEGLGTDRPWPSHRGDGPVRIPASPTLVHCLAGLDNGGLRGGGGGWTGCGWNTLLRNATGPGCAGERTGFVFQSFNLLSTLTVAEESCCCRLRHRLGPAGRPGLARPGRCRHGAWADRRCGNRPDQLSRWGSSKRGGGGAGRWSAGPAVLFARRADRPNLDSRARYRGCCAEAAAAPVVCDEHGADGAAGHPRPGAPSSIADTGAGARRLASCARGPAGGGTARGGGGPAGQAVPGMIRLTLRKPARPGWRARW